MTREVSKLIERIIWKVKHDCHKVPTNRIPDIDHEDCHWLHFGNDEVMTVVSIGISERGVFARYCDPNSSLRDTTIRLSPVNDPATATAKVLCIIKDVIDQL